MAPAHRVPRQGSAPCLPVSVDHGAVSEAPPEDSQGPVTPAPHTLREELQEFLEDVRSSCNKVQLALRRWRDFHQILHMGEGKRTRKQAAKAYQWVHLFRDSLLTYGVANSLGLTLTHLPSEVLLTWVGLFLISVRSESGAANLGILLVPTPLPAAPIDLERRTAARGSRNWLKMWHVNKLARPARGLTREGRRPKVADPCM
ncbi:hypothetical protein UY3_08403 [Chelonia mydas]|uniref:Uncharacterized protein n=1 Tax=Chelonia mydas TaxID=8469 RepID=M7BQS4_CHEMY|nr:hypothetical protein UY3_08403 [Chelonia mydas]